MTQFLVAFAIDLVIFAMAGGLFYWWYQARIGRRAQLESYQYSLFSLRDRAIRLAMDGTLDEADPRWQSLYRQVNDSARAASVDRMTNGFSFVMSMLKHARPPEEKDIEEFRTLPDAARKIWIDYVVTVITICIAGSQVLRMALWLAHHWKRFKKWIEEHRPDEARNYRGWQHSAQKFTIPCGS